MIISDSQVDYEVTNCINVKLLKMVPKVSTVCDRSVVECINILGVMKYFYKNTFLKIQLLHVESAFEPV